MKPEEADQRALCLALVCQACEQAQPVNVPALIDLHGPAYPLESVSGVTTCRFCQTSGQFALVVLDLSSYGGVGKEPAVETSDGFAATLGKSRASSVFQALCVIVAMGCVTVSAIAHPGGLNAEGCHTNRKTGEYHCHHASKPKSFSAPTNIVPKIGKAKPFANCAAARAAGAAPVRLGDPGYSKRLDRDGDGVGCE